MKASKFSHSVNQSMSLKPQQLHHFFKFSKFVIPAPMPDEQLIFEQKKKF